MNQVPLYRDPALDLFMTRAALDVPLVTKGKHRPRVLQCTIQDYLAHPPPPPLQITIGP